TPEMPNEEICNGLDDDCDGVSDQDERLCEDDLGGARCVVSDEEAYCGCESDEDCGEGLSCHPEDRLCVPSSADCECVSVGAGQVPSGTNILLVFGAALLSIGRRRVWHTIRKRSAR